MDKKVLPRLEKYFDAKRVPYAYSSYITGVKPSGRFYDDNIWLDKNPLYINSYKNSLDYVWMHARDKDGLFDDSFTQIEKNKKKWLLTQAAFAEMYARIATL